MTVKFENTKENVTQYFLYLNDRLPINKVLSLVKYLLIAFLGFSVFGKLSALFHSYTLSGLISLLIDLGLIYILMTFRKFGASMTMKSGAGKTLTGNLEYSVTPEGMVALSQYGRSLLFWNGIESITETKDFFAFHFSAAQAFFIPKRAFSSPEQGAAFLQLIEHYRQAATGAPIPQTTKGAWWTQGQSVMEEERQSNRTGSN